MIRVTQQNSGAAAKKYYATADYYSEGQEIIGSWGGKGASRLGLEGKVDKFSFERLCDNLDPQTGKPLTVRTRTERRVGYDFTFSVPKSVSLLYAMSGDQGIMDAFRGSVDETMREMEAEMKTRVRMDGKDEDRVTGNMVWAEFIHTTSRPVDGRPRSAIARPLSSFSTPPGTMRNVAGKPASSANSSGMPRTSRRHFAFGWRTGSRIWASALSGNGTISRLPGYRRMC